MSRDVKKLRAELASKNKPRPKKQVVVDVVCFKCGSRGTVTTSGILPKNEDGTNKGLCHDCHSFWSNGKTRSGRDLPGQRFLCFHPIQKGC